MSIYIITALWKLCVELTKFAGRRKSGTHVVGEEWVGLHPHLPDTPIKYNLKKVEAQACYLLTQKRENQVRGWKVLAFTEGRWNGDYSGGWGHADFNIQPYRTLSSLNHAHLHL